MKLQHLLGSLEYSLVKGSIQTDIIHLTEDSRDVCEGSLFFIRRGFHTDGKKFLKEALDKGTRAVVCEAVDDELLGLLLDREVCAVVVADIDQAMQAAAGAFYDNPQHKLKLIGVTGTKGKTTVSMLIRQVVCAMKQKALLVGTNGIVVDQEVYEEGHTTPPLLSLYRYLALGVEKGCQIAVLEVSSLAVKQRRIEGLTFELGIFTNFYPDHIGEGEHETLEEYRYWKACFLKRCKRCIINEDDNWGRELAATLSSCVTTYSVFRKADFFAAKISYQIKDDYLGCQYQIQGGFSGRITLAMPGIFNVSNSLAVAAAAEWLGGRFDILQQVFLNAHVKGRCQLAGNVNGASIMIDYAHNESSLEAVLAMVKAYKPARVICMFGCGGERSRLRRYGMGRISAKMADLTVITQDNSRQEAFELIFSDIIEGLNEQKGRYVTVPDRYEAIRYCIQLAKPGDFILLLGKGHEEYQETAKGRVPFSDERAVKELLSDSGKENRL